MKKAFTLIELLVVVAIIGILASVLLVATSGVSDRAKATKCAANMKSLATACNAVAVDAGAYPPAQSLPYQTVNPQGRTGTETAWYVTRGWVSWLDEGVNYETMALQSEPNSPMPSYAGTPLEVTHALTNGTLWRAVGGRRDVYLCPVHVKACQKKGVSSPGWSYQMNAFFGAKDLEGTKSHGSLGHAETRLLFAEIPAVTVTSKITAKTGVSSLPEVKLDGGKGDAHMDGCLLYKSLGGSESIGFNHVQGKQIVGHVAFADGHVESFAAPKNGNFIELTDWLCTGMSISYYNGDYEGTEVDNIE